jgi:hypothetical protein
MDLQGKSAGTGVVLVLGCGDEDSAYISKRMLRVGTSDDARVSTVVNTPKGRGFLSLPSSP